MQQVKHYWIFGAGGVIRIGLALDKWFTGTLQHIRKPGYIYLFWRDYNYKLAWHRKWIINKWDKYSGYSTDSHDI